MFNVRQVRLFSELNLSLIHHKNDSFLAIPWCIWVYTSDMKGAGTDAQVKLVLYGRDGKTDEVTLKSDKKAFEAGACDEFKENLDEVGIPVKLRVQHDNSRSFAAWHLDRVRRDSDLYKR